MLRRNFDAERWWTTDRVGTGCPALGCTDETACNYNERPTTTVHATSCLVWVVRILMRATTTILLPGRWVMCFCGLGA